MNKLLYIFVIGFLQMIIVNMERTGGTLRNDEKTFQIRRSKRQTLADLLKRYEKAKKQWTTTTTTPIQQFITVKSDVSPAVSNPQTDNSRINTVSRNRGTQRTVDGGQRNRPVSIFDVQEGQNYKVHDSRRTKSKTSTQQNSPTNVGGESVFIEGVGRPSDSRNKASAGPADFFHKEETKLSEQTGPVYHVNEYSTGGEQGQHNENIPHEGQGQTENQEQEEDEYEEDEMENEEENSPPEMNPQEVNNGTYYVPGNEEEAEEAEPQPDQFSNTDGISVELRPLTNNVKYEGGDIFVTKAPQTTPPQNHGRYVQSRKPYYLNHGGGDVFAQPVHTSNTNSGNVKPTNTAEKNNRKQTVITDKAIERLITNLQGGDIFKKEVNQQGQKLAIVDQQETESDTADNEVHKSVITSDHVGPHASTAFGIVIGILIALVFVIGPLICFVYQYRQKRLQKEKRENASRFFTGNRDNGIMEAMLMSEIGREMTYVNQNVDPSYKKGGNLQKIKNQRKNHNETPTMSDFEGGRYSPTYLP